LELVSVMIKAVVFYIIGVGAKEAQKEHNPDEQKRAQRDMFQGKNEKHAVRPEDIAGTAS
jgi:hypothetical protein